MITDLTDPRCNPKAIFRKFKKYLNSHKWIDESRKPKTFQSHRVLSWLIKLASDPEELQGNDFGGNMHEIAVEVLPKLLSCWEQCGFIEPYNGDKETIHTPWTVPSTVIREWKIITRRKQ